MDIITFCASHITNENRIKFQGNAIESICNQTYKICIYVSVSIEDSDLIKTLTSTIILKYKNHNFVKIFVHVNKKISQFEHFDYLVQQIDPIFINRTWVMFMDDDDFSRAERSLFYNIYTQNKDRNCMSIHCPYVLYYYQNQEIKDLSQTVCFSALNKGQAYVYSSHEYVTFCVRLRVLVNFLSIVKKHNLLKTPMCDVAFSSILYNTSRDQNQIKDLFWLYAYNQHQSGCRSSKKYGTEYYVRTYNKKFLNDLASLFNITQWKSWPGYTPIMAERYFKKAWWKWW